jgi:hypothetical protein
MIEALVAMRINNHMIGAAASALMTAAQISALMGLISNIFAAAPSKVATAMVA